MRESIAIWLRKLVREQGLNHDFGDGIDINLVFADMCGINMTIDGKQRSVWGGASD